MKRKFTKHPVLSATQIQLSDRDKKMVLDLAEDMLYQTYDNSPEYNENEAYECVLDHVIMVISEMDDDNKYSDEVRKVANYKNRSFANMIRDCVEEHYDEYSWNDY